MTGLSRHHQQRRAPKSPGFDKQQQAGKQQNAGLGHLVGQPEPAPYLRQVGHPAGSPGEHRALPEGRDQDAGFVPKAPLLPGVFSAPAPAVGYNKVLTL